MLKKVHFIDNLAPSSAEIFSTISKYYLLIIIIIDILEKNIFEYTYLAKFLSFV